MSHKRVLIAPLDWGLGHAARIIPLISRNLQDGNTVIIGGSGASFRFLKAEFPKLKYVELPGTEIKYSKGRNQLIKLLLQYPRMKKIVREEYYSLQRIIEQEKIDLVISDNRYGLYSDKIPCIFITHQLSIRAGAFSKIVNRINHKYIGKFNVCMIPDHVDFPGLAGELSHCETKLKNIEYSGPLSRFTREADRSSVKKYKFIAVISGPEPQRSIFEKLVKEGLNKVKEECIVVRGVSGNTDEAIRENHLTLFNSCSGKMLEELFDQSEYLIARSGYSTIMDLEVLKMPAILVPTPGQKEQEYLADLHRNRYLIVKQGELNRYPF